MIMHVHRKQCSQETKTHFIIVVLLRCSDTSYVSPADLGSKVNATSTASPGGGGGGGLPGWAKVGL